MSIPFIDNNGNLISNNSIIAPNQSYNVNGWGNYVHNGNQWNMVLNNEWQNTLGKSELFNSLNPADQQGLSNYLAQSGIDPLKASMNDINNVTKQYMARQGNAGSNNGLGLFGTDQNGNKTFMGGTGLNWAGFGLQAGLGLYGAYQQNKQLGLAKQAFEEQRALQRANYKMQAKSYNNSLRNQQSGRGYVGMSGASKRTLGQEYNSRKAEETY